LPNEAKKEDISSLTLLSNDDGSDLDDLGNAVEFSSIQHLTLERNASLALNLKSQKLRGLKSLKKSEILGDLSSILSRNRDFEDVNLVVFSLSGEEGGENLRINFEQPFSLKVTINCY